MSQSPELSLGSVSERDIDFLLLEEFTASPDFANWFIGEALGDSVCFVSVLSSRRSVAQLSGESDLEITFRDTHAGVRMLMIENKINAGFQPQQAERYRQRGEVYIARGFCTGFSTVLVAPARYFGTTAVSKFDGCVNYESISEWFAQASSLGQRGQYKRALLKEAIKKGTLGYQPEEDAAVTAFWYAYWRHAREYAPELEMVEPGGKPARAGFVHFCPPLLPPELSIIHKLTFGRVDLQFRGMGRNLSKLNTTLETLLEPDMRIDRASGSGAIRIDVPPLKTVASADDQAGAIRAGLEAAKRLFKWFERNQSHFHRI